MPSFGVAASAATVAVFQVPHTIMLAPPEFGTYESFDGFPCGIIMMLEAIVRVGEKGNSKVQTEDGGSSMV